MSEKKRVEDDSKVECAICIYCHTESKKPQCRRNAPVRRAVDDGWIDGWPTTKESEWCGEWTGIDEEGGLISFEAATMDIVGAEEGDEDDEGEEEVDDEDGE